MTALVAAHPEPTAMPLAPARIHPRRPSHELRETTSPELRRRRWMVGLSLVCAAIGRIATLCQVGIRKRLPDPPSDLFDSPRVNAAPYA